MPSSPSSNKPLLTISGVAKLFIKLRRHSTPEASEDGSNDEGSPHPTFTHPPIRSSSQAPSASEEPEAGGSQNPSTPPSTPKRKRTERTSESSTSGVASATSPSSPRSLTRQKSQRTECSSGTAPLSHPGLAENACARREIVERTDTYVCEGGVNVPILLRTTRTELMDTASVLGANALVEEQWKCTILGPKKAAYKVQIHYKAHATRCTRVDPHQPVALNQTHSIPGLMTILRRND